MKKRQWGVDLTGKRFGKLFVQSKADQKNKQGRVVWKCLCDCGKPKLLATPCLVYGRNKSCRKCNEIEKGQRFNSLTVVSRSKLVNSMGRTLWNCLCDCGKKVRVADNHLKTGNTKSCGCTKLDALNRARVQKMIENYGAHLPSNDPWYVRAAAIIARVKKREVKCEFKSSVELALYLKEITPKKCPVFGKRLSTGTGSPHKWSPSIDRIIPSKGYVRGNLQVISYKANTMKQDASRQELKQFARWALQGE